MMANADQRRMPARLASAKVSPRTIGELLSCLEKFQRDEVAVRAEYPWANRFVMGCPLAPWQRGLKWDELRMQRFVHSAWIGVGLGTYSLVEMALEDEVSSVVHKLCSECILDGQQRLNTLERYFTNELAVPDAAGQLTTWAELGMAEQRSFCHRTFDRVTVPWEGEAQLRSYYDLMNFGGVAHEERERAVQVGSPGVSVQRQGCR